MWAKKQLTQQKRRDLPEEESAEVISTSARIRQKPKHKTIHLAQAGISARGSFTPKYIVTTAHVIII